MEKANAKLGKNKKTIVSIFGDRYLKYVNL